MERDEANFFRDDDIPMLLTYRSDAVHASKHATYPVAYELELHRMVELVAYFLAENDSFRRSPLDYWLTAEQSCIC
jgi:hypothetical protein